MEFLVVAIVIGIISALLFGHLFNAGSVISPLGITSGICGAFLGAEVAAFYNIQLGDVIITNLLTATVGAFLLIFTARWLRLS